MSVYLIVHGGFVGGWVWRQVANLMRGAGHEVFTPTLTGLGERAHLANPETNLNTHIQDILGVLECEDLWQVILVGHSSGSMVITGVAEKAAARLSRLVYIDTAIPEDGQSWFDLLGPEVALQLLALSKKGGDDWQVPFFLPLDPPRFRPHPLKTVTDSLEIKNPAAVHIPRAFIHCTARPAGTALDQFWPRVDRVAENVRQQGWWYRALPTDHNAGAIDKPQQLAELLLELG